MKKKTSGVFSGNFVVSALLGAGFAFLLFRSFHGTPVGDLLVGHQRHAWTLQNLMWVVFFVGLGKLFERFRQAGRERKESMAKLLPEDDETILTQAKLPPIYRKARERAAALFLPRLIRRIILQFNTSNSIDSASALLNSSVDLYIHELELRYNFLRYVVWLIPTLGFIGTIVGIADALNYAGQPGAYENANFLAEITKRLGVAFYTTLLALLQAAVFVFLLHVVQGEEEDALNTSAQYCLDNLINRLYSEKSQS